jgi:hypothetical protein
MVHMPGHIFFRPGDSRAKESFAASMKADEQYMKAQHVKGRRLKLRAQLDVRHREPPGSR